MGYKKFSTATLIIAIFTTNIQADDFRKPSNTELDKAIATQFVTPMLFQDASVSSDTVQNFYNWAKLDVDGDKYDELFIKITKEGMCAENGCPIVGFKKNDKEYWDVILTAVGNSISSKDKIIIIDDSKWSYDLANNAMKQEFINDTTK